MSAGVLRAGRQRAPSSTPDGMNWTPTAAWQPRPISSRPRTSFLIQDILWDGAEGGESGGFGSSEDSGVAAMEGGEGSSALEDPPGTPCPPGASQDQGTPQEADAGKGVDNPD